MTDDKGPGWNLIQGLVPALEGLRKLRYEPSEIFADIPDAALVQASRWLRASSYSALEGARKLEFVLRQRHLDEPGFDPQDLNPAPLERDPNDGQ